MYQQVMDIQLYTYLMEITLTVKTCINTITVVLYLTDKQIQYQEELN